MVRVLYVTMSEMYSFYFILTSRVTIIILKFYWFGVGYVATWNAVYGLLELR
jgi:hypothetical protein